MAHFAELDESNHVVRVVSVNNNDAPGEAAGVAFLAALYGHSRWKQTSYNGSIRKNFAGSGYTYDEVRDAFIPPKPFASWLFDEATCRWQAPTPMPQDGDQCWWDEAAAVWRGSR